MKLARTTPGHEGKLAASILPARHHAPTMGLCGWLLAALAAVALAAANEAMGRPTLTMKILWDVVGPVYLYDIAMVHSRSSYTMYFIFCKIFKCSHACCCLLLHGDSITSRGWCFFCIFSPCSKSNGVTERKVPTEWDATVLNHPLGISYRDQPWLNDYQRGTIPNKKGPILNQWRSCMIQIYYKNYVISHTHDGSMYVLLVDWCVHKTKGFFCWWIHVDPYLYGIQTYMDPSTGIYKTTLSGDFPSGHDVGWLRIGGSPSVDIDTNNGDEKMLNNPFMDVLKAPCYAF